MAEAEDRDLDALFALARGTPAVVPDGLAARILADAAAAQPVTAGRLDGRLHGPGQGHFGGSGWLSDLLQGLGGGRVLAGLGTAAVAGVMVGFFEPAPLAALTRALSPDPALEAVDLFPALNDVSTEG